MVKSDIIKKLKQKYPNLSNSQISSVLDVFFNTIAQSLMNNKSVEIRNFGRYSVKTIKAKHNARNPKTGSIIYVPERKKIAFKMSKHLKEEINKEWQRIFLLP